MGEEIKTDDVTAAQLRTAESASDKEECKAKRGKMRGSDWLIGNNQNEKVLLPEPKYTNLYL